MTTMPNLSRPVPTPTLVSPTSNNVVLSPITPYSPGTAPPQPTDEVPNAPRKKLRTETALDTTVQTQNEGESLEASWARLQNSPTAQKIDVSYARGGACLRPLFAAGDARKQAAADA